MSEADVGASQGDDVPLASSAPEPSADTPAVSETEKTDDGSRREAKPSGAVPSSVAEEVARLKAVLDSPSAAATELLKSLTALRALGSLPTKVLSDTMIGRTVNQLAKGSSEEAVRSSAKLLVEEWRHTHRKRKSNSNLGEAISQPPLQRINSTSAESSTSEMVDSAMSLGSSAEPPVSAEGQMGQRDAHREKVLQRLIEVLGKEEEIETKGDCSGEERQRDPVVLAGEIEEALAAAKPKKEAYLSQARSVLYNLKDTKNPTFRFKLLVGFYKPEDVPALTAEDMASDEKNAERAAQRKYAMEEIQTDWALKHGQQRITGMFTCGKCKGTKTTYFQMQTRSSDEPMTTFVTCLTCNNRWKFC